MKIRPKPPKESRETLTQNLSGYFVGLDGRDAAEILAGYFTSVDIAMIVEDLRDPGSSVRRAVTRAYGGVATPTAAGT